MVARTPPREAARGRLRAPPVARPIPDCEACRAASEFSGTREAGSSDGQDAIETRVSTDTLTRLVNLANLGELRPQQRSPSSRNAARAGGFPARWRARLAACPEAASDPENPSGPLCYSRHFAAPLAETGFDWGVRRFGYLLTSAMLIMVLLGFVVHMFGDRPRLETLSS